MQILKIIIWPKNRKFKPRCIGFELGKVNIVFGGAKTGKSCVWPIIDYCLGSSKIRVPVGVSRDEAEWYGIVIYDDFKYYQVCRNLSDRNKYSFFVLSNPNDLNQPKANIKEKYIKDLLNRRIKYIPGTKMGKVSYRDLTVLNYIAQHSASNPYFLFHKNKNDIVNSKVKHGLPYILNTIHAGNSLIKSEKEEISRKERVLRGELDFFKKRMLSLYQESVNLGLVSSSMGADYEWKTDELIIELNHIVKKIYKKYRLMIDGNSLLSDRNIERNSENFRKELRIVFLVGRIVECLKFSKVNDDLKGLGSSYRDLDYRLRVKANESFGADLSSRKISEIVRSCAKSLELDYFENDAYFDFDKMCIKISGVNNVDIDLFEVGGVNNHIGYNIAFYLAMHEVLISLDREPVLSFLLIDQPSLKLSEDCGVGADGFRKNLLSVLDDSISRLGESFR